MDGKNESTDKPKPESIGAKETGVPGVFKQDTYKVAYRNGFEKKKQVLAAKRKQAEELAAKNAAKHN